MYIKWIIILILSITGSLGYMPSVLSAEDSSQVTDAAAEDSLHIPDVAATVNGHNITREELEGRMTQSRTMDPERFDAMDLEQRKKAVVRTIDSMVLRELISQEAVKRKVVVTDEEVNLNLESLKRQFPSEEAFEKAFADARITITAWKEENRKNLMAMKLEDMMADELQIPDKDIADYYEKNKTSLNKDSVNVSHILVETEKEAKKIIRELKKKKKDFKALAKKYSKDTFTKDKGGNLGWYGKGELLKVVEDAADSLSPGQTSAPVKSQYGYHIVRLDGKKTASEQTLEDHREHVRSILKQAKWQQWRPQWIEGLISIATVWKWAP